MDPDQTHLNLEVRQCGQFIVYEPSVEHLDEERCRALLAQLEPPISSARNLVLNFEHVDFLGSAALGMVATIARRLREQGAILRICCLKQGPRHVFSLTNMDKVLDGIFPTEVEAVMFNPLPDPV